MSSLFLLPSRFLLSRLAILFFIVGNYFSSAHALEIGLTHLNSGLNQPLDLHIPLDQTKDIRYDQISVKQPSIDFYHDVDVEYTPIHEDLIYQLEEDYADHFWLHITSSKPITEPYLLLLTEIMWPTGRLIKELAVPISEFSDDHWVAHYKPKAQYVSTLAASKPDTVIQNKPVANNKPAIVAIVASKEK